MHGQKNIKLNHTFSYEICKSVRKFFNINLSGYFWRNRDVTLVYVFQIWNEPVGMELNWRCFKI